MLITTENEVWKDNVTDLTLESEQTNGAQLWTYDEEVIRHTADGRVLNIDLWKFEAGQPIRVIPKIGEQTG